MVIHVVKCLSTAHLIFLKYIFSMSYNEFILVYNYKESSRFDRFYLSQSYWVLKQIHLEKNDFN